MNDGVRGGRPLISVCIPVYNHANLLREQFEQLQAESWDRGEVEFVVVDDASKDDVSSVVEFAVEAGWRVVFFRHEVNRGRAAAMAASVRIAAGEFMMFMDADDRFEAGAIQVIVSSLRELQGSGSEGVEACGLVFGTNVATAKGSRSVLPPDGVVCSLLSLRADFGVKGDLKEIVRSDLVKAAICPLFEKFRRVPTSLIWARVSGSGAVRCHALSVVRKVYLPGGMTRNINRLRAQSVPALLEAYREIVDSSTYQSRLFRARAAFNFHRFRMWGHAGLAPPVRGWVRLPGALGGVFGWFEFRIRAGTEDWRRG